MRMIDADALAAELYKHHTHDDEELEPLVYLAEAEKVIADVPTVDAIPVEWLMGIRDILYRSSSHAAGDMLSRVIEMWQKEQEAR